MLDPNNPAIWSGWKPPPGAPKAWDTWINNYNQRNKGKGSAHDPALHGEHPYGHNIKGWPDDWNGMGPPLEGMAPPPWAYVPKNMGKPSFCYDRPLQGHCKESLTRYGYNGYMDQCMPFEYSGCGGNRNNFVKEENCKKACMAIPTSGCDTDSKIPVDSWVWSRRCGYSDDEPSDYMEVRHY
ncbi:hypothetical protein ABMA27_005827 [Loxostege sticticalis]|uniref:BPTI/Kunitz inhibitor domain-containing protein n=1 Tax=Loxostege sticticalis TaxID=481309 RepID=A0ABR3HH17_LOXSC